MDAERPRPPSSWISKLATSRLKAGRATRCGPRKWKECRDFAVFIGGPNPALRDDQPYSQAHFDEVCGRFGDPAVIARYETIFIDSITWPGGSAFNGAAASQRPLRQDRQAGHSRARTVCTVAR